MVSQKNVHFRQLYGAVLHQNSTCSTWSENAEIARHARHSPFDVTSLDSCQYASKLTDFNVIVPKKILWGDKAA